MRQTQWVWVLVALALASEWCQSCYGCLAEERVALLEIKAWINQSNNTSWKTKDWVDNQNKDADCCKWSWVQCDGTARRVTGLYLEGARPSYMALGDLCLNASLFLPFEELDSLFISDNKLVGCFENQGFEVVASRLRKLKAVDLRNNRFKDNILSSLSRISSLTSVDLTRNMLTGSTPFNALYNLTNLQRLLLDHNFLPKNFLQNIGALSALRVLSFRNCSLNGTLPSRGWCELKNLHTLALSSNNLEGLLPDCLGNLSSLQIFDVSGNHFTGNIASGPLTNLTLLRHLSLSRNRFEIPISFKAFANHSNLQLFSCHSNKLIAEPTFPNFIPKFQLNFFSVSNCTSKAPQIEIPNFLYHQYDLRVLDLSQNNFSGMFPSWLFENNTRLERLYLRDNSFVGPLQVANQPNLKLSPFFTALDISNNHFTGMLPRWISNISSLKAIDFSTNQFEGPIPREFCKLNRLEFVDFSDNSLSGSIPSCFNPPYLSYVYLSKNQFNGPLTDAFFNSSLLVTLDLGYNNLTGHIPNWIGENSELRVLILKANHFEGLLPSRLCLLKQLRILDVSKNKFSGPLPSCFGNLTFKAAVENNFFGLFSSDGDNMYPLVTIDETVEFTTKTNSYTYKGDILNFMSGIDFSDNRFTSEIPPEFGKLSAIRALNMSHNNLTGHIPITFSGLEQTESLDLSYNNLNGEIPQQLTELHSLAVFNVSYNNLSGKAPERKAQFGTFDESSYVGNSLLCGPQLHRNCSKTDPPSQLVPNNSVHEQEDDGFMDMDVFYVSFGVCYTIVVLTIATVLYINPYWRRIWFYFIEQCIDTCYCFWVINYRKLFGFRRS